MGSAAEHMFRGLRWSGRTVLDAGTGAGRATAEIARRMAAAGGGRIISVDRDAEAFDLARRRLGPGRDLVEFIAADLSALPLGDNCIDTVICSATLAAVNTRPLAVLRVLHEFYRVLKPGGRLIIRDEHPSVDDHGVGGRRWRLYKAVCHLASEPHYEELEPEDVVYAAASAGFHNLSWRSFAGSALTPEVMEEWSALIQRLAARLDPAAGAWVLGAERELWSEFERDGGHFPRQYVIRGWA